MYREQNLKNNYINGKYITRYISAGPHIKYYFTGGNMIPFLELSYLYSNLIGYHADGNSLSFSGGINYFLTKNAALEPFIKYTRATYLQADQKNNSISIGLRVNYFIFE